jgi:hypothetical protein
MTSLNQATQGLLYTYLQYLSIKMCLQRFELHKQPARVFSIALHLSLRKAWSIQDIQAPLIDQPTSRILLESKDSVEGSLKADPPADIEPAFY